MRRLALRRLIGAFLAFAVLFAQTAALAYACQREAPQEPSTTVAPCPAHIDGADDSSSEPSDAGNLCKVHCETPTPPDGVTPIVAIPAALGDAYVPRAPARRALHSRRPEARGVPPFLILRTSRLLI